MRAMRAAVVGTMLAVRGPPTRATGNRARPRRRPWRPGSRRPELPRTGLVADAPKGAFEIGIAADGAVLTNGKEGGLLELRVALRAIAADPRMQDPDGAVRADVVLRASAAVPWPVVQWVMQECAQSRFYRLYFAVLPEQGGPEGVIDAFLPRDRGIRAPGPTSRRKDAHAPGLALRGRGHRRPRDRVRAPPRRPREAPRGRAWRSAPRHPTCPGRATS